MTLLTVAEILSGETLVSPSGPIDAATAADTTETPVWGPAEAAELKAVKVPAQPIVLRREIPVEAGVAL